MKKLVSPGVELVLSNRSSFVARVSPRSARVFGSPGAFADVTEPWDLNLFFVLADGHTYRYTYPGHGSYAQSTLVAAWLNTEFPTGTGVPAGGILFNASIRAGCLSKALD